MEDEYKVFFSVGKDNSIIVNTHGEVPLGELEEAIATLKGWWDSGSGG